MPGFGSYNGTLIGRGGVVGTREKEKEGGVEDVRGDFHFGVLFLGGGGECTAQA